MYEYSIKKQQSLFYRIVCAAVIVLAIAMMQFGLIDVSKVSGSFLSAVSVGIIICLVVIWRAGKAAVMVDDDMLIYRDIFLPKRKISLSNIVYVRYSKERGMVVRLKSGGNVNIDYVFEAKEEFLDILRDKGVNVLNKEDLDRQVEERMAAKKAGRRAVSERKRMQRKLNRNR